MANTLSQMPVNYIAERRQQSRVPVLNSWKEIAAYLKCGVRTAQRWELDLALPVYRPRPGKRGPVCAFPVEIQAWLRRNKDKLGAGAPDASTDHNSIVSMAHQLTHQSSELVRITARNTRIQQEYAARLLKSIEVLRAKVERRARLQKPG